MGRFSGGSGRHIAIAGYIPAPPFEDDSHVRGFSVTVIFTSQRSTLCALKRAGVLAHDLAVSIRVLVPQIVPFPLALEAPPIDIEFTKRRFEVTFANLAVTRIDVFFCREVADCLARALGPRALVLIGGRKRWWPTLEERLAQSLRRAGHHAIFVCDEKN